MEVLSLPLPSLLGIASAVVLGAAIIALLVRRGSSSDPHQSGRQDAVQQAANGVAENSAR